ncbi:unnamed protein product [Spirodela intermedia]|uniref:Secreted protein n=1 Tax=Spirodela intermedia TaxID=51605 RepID=A0ABN7EAE6_SPIIN|nr:unnamed protein product [Spirodela intermedia]
MRCCSKTSFLWRRIVVLAAMELAAMVGLMIVPSSLLLSGSLHAASCSASSASLWLTPSTSSSLLWSCHGGHQGLPRRSRLTP